jgi:hypothetical protein
MAADGWVSPWGQKTATAGVRNAPGAVVILAFEANRLSQGWTEEVATCSGLGRRSGEERRAGRRLALLNALGRGVTREKGGGRVGATWGPDKSREGGTGVWRRVSRHGTGAAASGRSDSGGRGCDRGGGGRKRREAQRLTVGRDNAGARWAAAGYGRVRRRGAALTCATGSTVPPDSVLNRFKPNQIYFKRI